jgi:hypothetical protein
LVGKSVVYLVEKLVEAPVVQMDTMKVVKKDASSVDKKVSLMVLYSVAVTVRTVVRR